MALDITEIKIRDKVTIAGTEITSVETTLTGGNSALPRADAVKAYVDGLLNANDAMQFKGTIGTGGTVTALPTTHSAGWTFRVITAATYAGVVTEVGDLIIAVVDRAGSGNANSDWTVVQTNIDGAVTGPASAVSANVARFNGTSGKIIQDSGVAFETTLTTGSDAKSPTSKAVATYVTGLGYVTSSGVTAVTGTAPIASSGGATPAISIAAATTSAAGSMSSADKTKLDGIAAGAQVNVATNLSYTDSTRVIASSTGTNATLPLVVAAGIAGLMTGADKTKLDGIASGATANTGTVTGVTGTAPIASSGGTAPVISITAATTSAAGSMSSADKTKLDGIAAGAQVNVATNLAQGTRTTTTVPITSSTGTSATLGIATTSLAGVMSSADKTKLDGIATGATANTGTVTAVTGTAPIVSSGGTAPAISISAATQSAAGSMSSADKTKLDGIATGATANAGTVTSVSAGTQISGMAMTITNGTTTPSIATSVSNAANFRTAIGAGTGNGTVTSVGGTGTVAGLTLSGTVTTTGNLTLGGTLSTPVSTINDSTTVGQNLVKLANPTAIRFIRINADNTVTARTAAEFRGDIGAGTVTSVGGTGTVSGLTLTGTVTTSGSLTLGGTLAVLPSNFASQTANTFLAAPNGSAGVPTFRTIVAADIPTLNQNTTGSAATLTTARTLTIGSTGKTFNGGANVSWSLAEIGAPASSSVVTLTGAQTVSGVKTLSNSFTGSSGTSTEITSQVIAGDLPSASLVATGLRVTAIGNSLDFHGATGIVAKAVGGLSNDAIAAYGIDGILIAPSDTSLGKYLRIKGVSGTSAPTILQTNSATSSSITVTLPSSTGTLTLNDHTHGNITNAGAIGSTSGLAVVTTTSGVLTTASRLPLSNLPTSATANRFLKVGTANTDPAYSALVAADIPNLSATKITADRLALDRLPTSATANRFLKVGTANTTPAYSALVSSDIPTLGNIQNNGTITSAGVAIGNGDRILISNNDNSQLIERGIDFGTSTTTFLRNDGQWGTPTDTNNFTNSLSFSKSTGILTLGRSGLTNLTANIYDGGGSNAIAIGNGSMASVTNAIAIGTSSSSGFSTNIDTIAIGASSQATGPQSIAIGKNSISNTISSVALGENTQATGTGSVAIGGGNQTTTGARATASDAVAIGFIARGTASAAVAVGKQAEATTENSVQLGTGVNSTTGTLQFRSYQLVDNAGIIPAARLPQIPGNWVLVGGSETSATTMAHTTSSSVPTMNLTGSIDAGDVLALEVSSSSTTTTAAQRNIVMVRLGTNTATTGMGMLFFASLNSTSTGNVNIWSALVRRVTATQIGTRYGGFENLSATGNKTFGSLFIFRVWRVVD